MSRSRPTCKTRPQTGKVVEVVYRRRAEMLLAEGERLAIGNDVTVAVRLSPGRVRPSGPEFIVILEAPPEMQIARRGPGAR